MALLTNGRPAPLAQYTLATLPTALSHVGSLIFVTDANSGLGAVAVSVYVAGGSPLTEAAQWVDVVDYTVVA